MDPQKIKENVFWVGAIDRKSKHFDELMPLPDGTSYNSFLIKGSKKTALIDTVAPQFKDVLINNLKKINCEKIDYIIANHAEQDHTGALKDILEKFPEAIIICNEKCQLFIEHEHNIPKEKFEIIEDKETISLGDKTLEFLFAPWVHWPETMFTYLKEEQILFTCDLFGAHLAFEKLLVENKEEIEKPAKRYYAEIMMPFSKMVKKHLEMIQVHKITMIAPSHGPIHKNPDIIINLHKEWTSNNIKQRIIIAYVSMHGSTKRMAEHLLWKAKEQGIETKIFNIMESDIGAITMSLINTSTFILCSPAYLGGLHPTAANLLFLINGFKPNIKEYSLLGSYGWKNNCGKDQMEKMFHSIKAEFLQPVFIIGYPKKDDFSKIDDLINNIKEKNNYKTI